MTAFTIVRINPALFIGLAALAIAMVSAAITAITMRAFLWPRYVEPRLEGWANGELSALKTENKDLRNQLRMRKQIIANYQHGMKVVAAGLASIGDVEGGTHDTD